jgi:hypothetical protein
MGGRDDIDGGEEAAIAQECTLIVTTCSTMCTIR